MIAMSSHRDRVTQVWNMVLVPSMKQKKAASIKLKAQATPNLLYPTALIRAYNCNKQWRKLLRHVSLFQICFNYFVTFNTGIKLMFLR